MSEAKGLKERIEYNEDFKLDWHDPDEATDGYQLKWIGKDYARLQSGTATETMIIPDDVHNQKEENKSSQNLFFTGDNLEVLKHLQNAYSNSIKMIYIDPPYNTGEEFVYSDTFEFSDEKLKNMLGMTDDEIKRLHTINGRSSHSAWLTFMYPRLKIAKKLLTEDGVIFISIDDNEQSNLKLLCDEIFREDNCVAQIVWKRKRGRDNSARWFSKAHEYLLIYAKSKADFNTNFLDLDEETQKAYKNPDNDPRGSYRMLGCWARGTQGGVKYDFTDKNGQYFSERLWLFSKDNLTKMDEEDKLIIRGDNIYRKMFITENKGKIPETLWDDVSNAANASDEIKSLFGVIMFDTPKPIPYIKQMIKIATDKDDIVFDFFSGSATTAHAVMQLNVEDGGNRKFIMVQLDEPTNKDSEARKEGYNTIDEISRKRIELAGQKIKKETNADIDYGFKHYYVKNVDIQTINKIEEFNPKTNFIGNEDMIREFDNEKSKGEDVILTTWLVDDGYKLDTKVDIKDFKGYKAYYIDNSILYLISQDWGTEQTKELLEQVGNNKFNLNTIIVYGYSFNFEAIKELQTNIKQNIDKTINIEKRY